MRTPNFSARAVRRRFFTARRDAVSLADATRESVVEFRLAPCASGLFVERRQFRVGAGLSSHAMCFEDEASFLRWCDADTLQFSYPLVCARLKSRGCGLLSRSGPASPSA